MNYEEARAYLREVELSLGWVLGLDSMRELLKRLGNPQDRLKFVHIAGTNGKGSVLAFVSQILSEAGYRVGRYISPRVFAYEEFVQINGEMITREEFCEYTARVREACQAMLAQGFAQPTLFEVETAIGFLHFTKHQCDIVALECGLGGRDDATNVITTAVCAVITAVGLDHMQYLGDTVYEIARTKSGIIKNGIPAVMCAQSEEAERAVEEQCAAVGASLTKTMPDKLTVHEGLTEFDGRSFMVFDYKDYQGLKIGLLGRYQTENASLAVEVAETLSRNGFEVKKEHIYAGLSNAQWHGRFELVGQNPRVVIDGAHNPPAAKRLRESVDYYFGQDHVVYVMGILADKDYEQVVSITHGAAEQIFTLTPDSPRALSAEALAEVIKKQGGKAEASDSYEEAARKALAAAGEDGVIVVFGSLTFLHELSDILEEMKAAKEDESADTRETKKLWSGEGEPTADACRKYAEELIGQEKVESGTEPRDLSLIRKELDELDRQLVELFERRMVLSDQVARYKMATGKPVRDLTREQEKLDRMEALADTPFNKLGMRELTRQIMAISRKRQYQMLEEQGMGSRLPFERLETLPKKNARVVYQGVPGAYAHIAAMEYFGEGFSGFYVKTWEDAMNALTGGRADFAVLPIENSTAGMVGDVYDLLAKYDNYIVGEIDIKVDHALLGLPGAKLDEIQQVYSHPQALMQCQKFLNEHKDWHQISVENTAVAARRVLNEGNPHRAAIASAMSGSIYGLSVIKAPLNFNSSNTTRFVITSSRKVYTEAASKICICFEVAHESGSLYNILSHFIFNGLNMFKIESRPVPGQTWEYRFFVEFTGNLSDSGVRNALTGISEEAVSMKILGNY